MKQDGKPRPPSSWPLNCDYPSSPGVANSGPAGCPFPTCSSQSTAASSGVLIQPSTNQSSSFSQPRSFLTLNPKSIPGDQGEANSAIQPRGGDKSSPASVQPDSVDHHRSFQGGGVVLRPSCPSLLHPHPPLHHPLFLLLPFLRSHVPVCNSLLRLCLPRQPRTSKPGEGRPRLLRPNGVLAGTWSACCVRRVGPVDRIHRQGACGSVGCLTRQVALRVSVASGRVRLIIAHTRPNGRFLRVQPPNALHVGVSEDHSGSLSHAPCPFPFPSVKVGG